MRLVRVKNRRLREKQGYQHKEKNAGGNDNGCY